MKDNQFMLVLFKEKEGGKYENCFIKQEVHVEVEIQKL